jgi:isoleucyl-tRNA synthetase
MADFKRLGVLGDWDHPYRTMDFANEANEIRAFKRVMERGFVYRGLKPVYWCFDCGSSLAEFEIEYQDKKSQTLDVAFPVPSPTSWPPPSAWHALSKEAFAVIWTTTAWTIPANQALNLNPELIYALVDTERGLLVLAETLVEKCLERYGLSGTSAGRGQGREARGHQVRAPAARCARGLQPPVARVPGRLRHGQRRHGYRALVARLRRGRLQQLRGARHAYDDILNPVQGNGRYAPTAAVRRHEHLEGLPRHHRHAARRRPPDGHHHITHSYPHCWRHKTPVIYRAAAQWFVRMDEGEGVFTTDKAPKRCARRRWPPSSRPASTPKTARPACAT